MANKSEKHWNRRNINGSDNDRNTKSSTNNKNNHIRMIIMRIKIGNCIKI